MEEENTNKSSREQSNKPFKETFKSGSADEVRERTKEVVEKGVAAVAGALRGFNKETERSQLPEQAKGAIHQAAQTTKSTVSSVTEEAKGLKEPLREAGQKLGETARDLRSSVREEVERTRSAVQGAGSGAGSGSSRGAGSKASGGMGMGGSELGPERSKSGQGTQMPDLRNTPLAQPDEKLQGKDLTRDLGSSDEER